MDITRETFWERLAEILLLIAHSDFIAIDMEITGIQVRYSLPQGVTILTIDQVYGRIQTAASMFKLFRLASRVCFGLTVIVHVAADPFAKLVVLSEAAGYKSFTFTIPISPIFAARGAEAIRLASITDRHHTIPYKSLIVLGGHAFDLEATLGHGVPYLTRDELRLVCKEMIRGKEWHHVDHTSLGD
jgi:hypothetical protein